MRRSQVVPRAIANLNIEWSFQNTNTQSCTRKPDGSLSCVSVHPDGFEWCVNAAVVDANGTVYVQQLAIGSAYTPASMDKRGRIYSQNDEILFVVGK